MGNRPELHITRITERQALVKVIVIDLHTEPDINKLKFAARHHLEWPPLHGAEGEFGNEYEFREDIKYLIPRSRALLQTICPGYPNVIVGIDMMGPLRYLLMEGRYLRVLVGYFTNWCEAVPLKHADTAIIMDTILDNWIFH